MKFMDGALSEDPGFAAEVEGLIDRMKLEQDVAARMEQLLNMDLTSDGAAPGHPTRIRKGRKTIGFLISVQDFRLFERLISEEEDRLDIAGARKTLQEPDGLSLEELEADLDL